jgi:hypothetical protein
MTLLEERIARISKIRPARPRSSTISVTGHAADDTHAQRSIQTLKKRAQHLHGKMSQQSAVLRQMVLVEWPMQVIIIKHDTNSNFQERTTST